MSEATMSGPCVICGAKNYPPSMGGPEICPTCDVGDFGYAAIQRQRSTIESISRKLEEARGRIAELELIADGKLKEAAQAYLKRAGTGPDGSYQFDVQASLVPLMAEHLAQMFKELGGENYVSLAMDHDEVGQLELIIKRRHGELPAAKASRLENECAAKDARIAELEAALRAAIESHDKIPANIPLPKWVENARSKLEGKSDA